MVSADGSSQSFSGLTAQIGWFGLRVGGHPALSLQSSNEAGELSQWLCHDDSTINIVLVIIIIIIIIINNSICIVPQSPKMQRHCFIYVHSTGVQAVADNVQLKLFLTDARNLIYDETQQTKIVCHNHLWVYITNSSLYYSSPDLDWSPDSSPYSAGLQLALETQAWKFHMQVMFKARFLVRVLTSMLTSLGQLQIDWTNNKQNSIDPHT